MEAVYRDYRDKVDFYYIYKTVEHHGINGFVEPFNIDERLKHVSIAKERINSEIPWLCDTMDNSVKAFFGRAPNGEYVIGPEGKVVRKRFWSDADVLRKDLEELVGKSETTTKPEDVGTTFRAETRGNDEVVSGVVPEIDLPKGLKKLKIEPLESDFPWFAKLRVEGTSKITKGGQLYFNLALDPIHKVHWNNLAEPAFIEIEEAESLNLSTDFLQADAVEAKADIDPRHFLVDMKTASAEEESSFIASVVYHVCHDTDGVCVRIEQKYRVTLEYDRDGGTRPGIFMTKMLVLIPQWDKNEDGKITLDELPKGNAVLIMNHIDYSGNRVIEKEEIEKFKKMFNDGKGFGRPDGTRKGEPPGETDLSSEEKKPKDEEEKEDESID